METKVHKRYIKFSAGFAKWVVVEEGIFSSPGLGWRPFISYVYERFDTEEAASRAAQVRSKAQLDAVIESTRKLSEGIDKEELFLEVMRLAWEEVEFILKADPDIRMHPREYIYRKLCGFKGDKDETLENFTKRSRL